MGSRSKTVLITGINGFTGSHLAKKLESEGFKVVGTSHAPTTLSGVYTLDITDKERVLEVLSEVNPDYIIHLAAISFVGHADVTEFYRVNVLGTENILDCAIKSGLNLRKVIVSSSANVYGNANLDLISETTSPEPVNHYACSKLSMEKITANYFNRLPIIITRPFNYTGIGQAEHFLVPKIVSHFKANKKEIELGNLDVFRDFSSIQFVVEAYVSLLTSNIKSEVVNICSGTSHSLSQIIDYLERIAGYKINVTVNPNFVRKDEVKKITGDNKKLFSFCPGLNIRSLEQTLIDMFNA